MDFFRFLTQTIASAAEPLFWMCAALVGYVYVGYPALIWGCSRLFGTVHARRSSDQKLPSVSLIIAAHNEEAVIRERVENLLALDYPDRQLEVIIASDGSTDRTCEIAHAVGGTRVRVLEFQPNRGKAAVLNDAISQARGELLVLSDANTMMDRRAVRHLARPFSDRRVGVVCGRLLLVDATSGQNVDGMYWKYETFLKRAEAQLGALLGANGAIYAIRRSLFPPLPSRIAVDDFVIPLLAKLQSGCSIIYEPKAVAIEETPAEISAEFARRSRIGAGGFHSVTLLWPLMSPFKGWIALSFVSHKLLRWICPFFLIGAAAANMVLASEPFYALALALQFALYGVATAGYFLPRVGALHRVIRLSTMFVVMNFALLIGFLQFAFGLQTGVWQRTARTPVSATASEPAA